MKKYHYVYRIINLVPKDERKYYIGVRSCDCFPEKDTNYMSSSKYLKESISEQGQDNFKKEILSIWGTREEANLEEVRLHEKFNVGLNLEYYNKAKSRGDGFCTIGQVTVIDTRDGLTKNVSKEEFSKFDYFKQCTQGRVTVIDTRDGLTKNVSKEEFDSCEYYNSIAKNTILVRNIMTGNLERIETHEFENSKYEAFSKNTVLVYDKVLKRNTRVDKEIFLKNKEIRYKALSKGFITALDIRDMSTKRISIIDYYKFDYYKNINSQIVKIYDKNNKLLYTIIGDFNKQSNDLGLPTRSLITSYRNDGSKLYKTISNPNHKNYKFKDWYAIKEFLK